MESGTSGDFLITNGLEVKKEDAVQVGVKGMRWGIRKRSVPGKPATVGPQAGKPGPDGAFRATVKGADGKEVPLSKDGENVLNAARKLQNAGLGTLSNAEIAAYTARIKLEDELIKTLAPPAPPSAPQSTGRTEKKKDAVPVKVAKFIGNTLTNEAAGQSKRVLNIVATNKINSELEKRGVELPNKKKKK